MKRELPEIKSSLELHKERHKMLHRYLDELVADFIIHTKKTLNETNLLEFMEWSSKQIKEPDITK
jgi:archaellum component FlaC